MKLPLAVEKIINKLENAGYEAYAVGGCVRDSLLGRLPDDWDITTSALPEETKQLFRRTIDTGIKHGTVTVLMSGSDSILRGERGYEVTTYRVDGEYLDGRHPSSVSFTRSLHEDLARRDFTINAMAYNNRSGIVDDFEGMQDLEKRQIRAVGKAEHRFQEDALRMLRALRFSAQLSFSIEEETYEAVKTLSENLKNVSKERIQVELSKLLLSHEPEKYRLIFETGLAPYITEHFPSILYGDNADEPENMDCPSMPDAAPRKKYLRYGMLLRTTPEDAGRILRELRLDNETIKMGKSIAELHSVEIPETEYDCRKLLSKYGSEIIEDWLLMEEAISAEAGKTPLKKFAENPIGRACGEKCKENCAGFFAVEETDEIRGESEKAIPEIRVRLERLQSAKSLVSKILFRGDCLSIAELAVNGQDLMEMGIEKGPMLGEALHHLLDYVLEHPERNTRKELLAVLKQLSPHLHDFS